MVYYHQIDGCINTKLAGIMQRLLNVLLTSLPKQPRPTDCNLAASKIIYHSSTIK